MKYALLLALLLIVGCTPQTVENTTPEVIFHTENKNIRVSVELPQTNEERARGLMYRSNLDEFDGMLFTFQTEKKHEFWMKNTLIPLDMIYVSSTGHIVDIVRADPCNADPCTVYAPLVPAQHVLEVNQNFTQRHGITLGDRLTLP